MEKVMVYPFDGKFVSCLRYEHLLNQYEFCGVVSPSGWGLTGKDAGVIDGGPPLGIIIQDNFEQMLKHCDTIFFVDTYSNVDYESLIYPKMIEAIKAGKNIVSMISSIPIDKENHIKIFNEIKTLDYNIEPGSQLSKIETPIIAVIGLSSNTNKFNIQLALRKEIQQIGYRVSQIGTRHYCEIFGFHSFPQYIYKTPIPEVDKIKLFNKFIKDIENKENPDVIILGIPGGIMPFNDQLYFDFGILSFQIFQSIHVDAIVLSLFCEEITKQYFDEINNLCKYRFGKITDCFNLSHQTIDWMGMENKPPQIDTCTIQDSQVEQLKLKYKKFNMPVFDSINPEDAHNMADLLINKLQSYSYRRE